jgi:hypothetical protein
MIEDIAELGGHADLPPAHAHDVLRHGPDRPVHDVDVVDVLLHDVITRQPGEVEPVAALPLHVGHVGLALPDPQVALVPVALRCHDLANLPVVDALDELQVERLVAPLRAGDDREAFLCRQLRGGDHGTDANRIDGDRFLHEDVFPGLDRRLEVDRAEPGGGGGDDHVHVGTGEDPEIVVEAGETPVRRNLDPIRELALQLLEGALDPVGHEIAERDHFDAGVGIEAVEGCACPASAAADDTDLDGVAAAGKDPQASREDRRDRRGRSRLAEITPVESTRSPVLSHRHSPFRSRRRRGRRR